MSRAANGTYTLPAGNPVVTGTVISSTWANTTLSDIATEMTDSLDRSGKGAMLAGLQLSDGLIGAPGLTFGTETTLGLYRTGAGAFAFVSGGINRLALASTGAWTLTGPTTANAALNINVTQAGAISGILITGNDAAFIQPLMVKNTNAGVAAINYAFEAANDTAGHELYMVNTSTTFNTALVTGATAGPACGLVYGNGEFVIAGLASNTARFKLTQAGVASIWEGINNVGTAGLMIAATYESGNFTATLTGCTTSPTALVSYRRVGPTVTIDIPATVALSNSTACTLTGLPAALSPIRTQGGALCIQSSGVNEAGFLSIVGASTVLTLRRGNGGTTTFVNDTLNKGIGVIASFTYNLT